MRARQHDSSYIAGYKTHLLHLSGTSIGGPLAANSPAEIKAYLRGAEAAEAAHRYGINLVPRHLKHLHN